MVESIYDITCYRNQLAETENGLPFLNRTRTLKNLQIKSSWWLLVWSSLSMALKSRTSSIVPITLTSSQCEPCLGHDPFAAALDELVEHQRNVCVDEAADVKAEELSSMARAQLETDQGGRRSPQSRVLNLSCNLIYIR